MNYRGAAVAKCRKLYIDAFDHPGPSKIDTNLRELLIDNFLNELSEVFTIRAIAAIEEYQLKDILMDWGGMCSDDIPSAKRIEHLITRAAIKLCPAPTVEELSEPSLPANVVKLF